MQFTITINVHPLIVAIILTCLRWWNELVNWGMNVQAPMYGKYVVRKAALSRRIL
jgi:hypothetical protein